MVNLLYDSVVVSLGFILCGFVTSAGGLAKCSLLCGWVWLGGYSLVLRFLV